MANKLRFRKSLADVKRANNAAFDHYALLSGRPTPEGLKNTVAEKMKRDVLHKSGLPLERDVMREIANAAQRQSNVKLWRNNMGMVETGNGGMLRYGVGPLGALDFIGYRTITITADMVGKRIAQFSAVEAKRPGLQAKPEQRDFIDSVVADGGVAGVAHSWEEAWGILGGKSWK